MIRKKNLACDDSEGVRDRPREGLPLPYSPCLSSGSTEVGLNIALIACGPLARCPASACSWGRTGTGTHQSQRHCHGRPSPPWSLYRSAAQASMMHVLAQLRLGGHLAARPALLEEDLLASGFGIRTPQNGVYEVHSLVMRRNSHSVESVLLWTIKYVLWRCALVCL